MCRKNPEEGNFYAQNYVQLRLLLRNFFPFTKKNTLFFARFFVHVLVKKIYRLFIFPKKSEEIFFFLK